MASEEWPPLAVVVPDDLRELDADVAAYQRELRRMRRTRWLPRGLRGLGFTGPALVAVMVLVGLVGGLFAFLAPQVPEPARALPLARPAAAAGSVGGLLPDVGVGYGGSPARARDLRPAVLLMVGPGCGCADLVRSLRAQATEFNLALVLVNHRAPAAEVVQLREAARGHLRVAVDDGGALLGTYGAGALVLVRADGTVASVVAHPSATARYEPTLAQLAAR